MSVVPGDLDQAPPGPLRAAWTTFYPDLITLVLILTGVMVLADVLTAYAVESAVLGAITLWYVDGWRALISRASLTFVLMPLAFGAIAAPHVHWGWGNTLGILGIVGTTAIAEIRAQRSAPRARRNLILTLLWRFVVIVFGSVVALGWVDDITQLGRAGWDATGTGIPMFPFGAWLNRRVITSGADPMLVATLFFFGFKTVNESLSAAYGALSARYRAEGGVSLLAQAFQKRSSRRPRGRRLS